MDIADRGSVLLLRDRLHSIFFIRIITEPRAFRTDPDTLADGIFQQRIDEQIALTAMDGERNAFEFPVGRDITA